MILLACLPALTACGKYNYTKHLSESKSDIFCAETEEFSITLSCVTREYPYLDDGITGARTKLCEIVLTSDEPMERDYTVAVLDDKEWGGEMSFRNLRGDWYYSQGVESFPEGSVALRVCWADEVRELTVTSVRSEKTLSPDDALSIAVETEKDTIDRLTQNGEFQGEFYVRLLRRDRNYYYVGIIDRGGKTLSLLLDAETGEVLARRAP